MSWCRMLSSVSQYASLNVVEFNIEDWIIGGIFSIFFSKIKRIFNSKQFQIVLSEIVSEIEENCIEKMHLNILIGEYCELMLHLNNPYGWKCSRLSVDSLDTQIIVDSFRFYCSIVLSDCVNHCSQLLWGSKMSKKTSCRVQ